MTQHEQYLEGARRRLEEAALQYARVKSLRFFLDAKGCRVTYSLCDHEMYLDHYRKMLLQEAETLLAQMATAPLPPRMRDES